MIENNREFVQLIVEGIQEIKGKKIVVVDMTALPERACDYFVIAEGNSSTHVSAIGDSVYDYLFKHNKTKPYAMAGFENAQWIAFDYGQVFVHIFQPEFREFYDLEHLWADAALEIIPDLD